jgi:hypothetical protein
MEPCRYGDKCYRKNPDHFKMFAHPDKEKSRADSRHADSKASSSVALFPGAPFLALHLIRSCFLPFHSVNTLAQLRQVSKDWNHAIEHADHALVFQVQYARLYTTRKLYESA